MNSVFIPKMNYFVTATEENIHPYGFLFKEMEPESDSESEADDISDFNVSGNEVEDDSDS